MTFQEKIPGLPYYSNGVPVQLLSEKHQSNKDDKAIRFVPVELFIVPGSIQTGSPVWAQSRDATLLTEE